MKITKMMSKEQCIDYGIFVALQVIPFFEKEYSKDKRPRLALIVAKKYLKK